MPDIDAAPPVRIGARYGDLLVREAGPRLRDGRQLFFARCKCGQDVRVVEDALALPDASCRDAQHIGETLPAACAPHIVDTETLTSSATPVAPGQRFGALVAGELVGQVRNGGQLWRCLCDCGEIVDARSGLLAAGRVRSCGCRSALRKTSAASAQALDQGVVRPRRDLAGQRFGALIVAELVGRNPRGDYLWRCLCDCGGSSVVRAASLRSGNTRTCGCRRRTRPPGASRAADPDLAGQIFGRLTVLAPAGRDATGKLLWRYVCACDDGSTGSGVAGAAPLRTGRVAGCGCTWVTPRPSTQDTLLEGKTIGQLTVVRAVGQDATGATRWRCDCACGGSVVRGASLLGGSVTSCGCARIAKPL